jgi:hypothetical protein
MIRQSKNLLAAAAIAVGIAGCFSDPTSALRGGAVGVQLTASAVTITLGDSVAVQAVVVDGQGNPLAITGATWATSDPAIAVVNEDLARPAPGNAFSRAFIVAKANGGAGTVTFTANGVTATVKVTSFPTSFPGTITNGAGTLSDPIVVSGGGVAVFKPTTAITINGELAWVVSRSTSTITVMAQRSGTGKVTIEDFTVSGVPIPTIESAADLVVSTTSGEANEPGNDVNGAVDISAALIALTPGQSLTLFGVVDDGTDIDDFFTFTLPAGGALDVVLEFPGHGGGGSTDPDLDLLVVTGYFAGFPFGAPGATGAQPEHHAFTAVAGTTYSIVSEAWDTGGAKIPYRLVITR